MTQHINDCIANTAQGQVRGLIQEGVQRFLGLPYAAPPLDALRLCSPRPPHAWQGIRDARYPTPAPPQTVGGIVAWIYPQPEQMSEDCLTLNIWTPDSQSQAKLPVVFWLYGGAFHCGHNNLTLTDGTLLAREGNMVVVAINYRLGALGFAGHPDLTDPLTGIQGNWGLQDQMQALEWVAENIGEFGGDPERITVMGQSAGAISAALLAQHERSQHLIQQLVLLSVPHIASPDCANAADQADYVGDFAQHLATDVKGLRNIAGQHLVAEEPPFARQYRPRGATGLFRRWPALDGEILRTWPVTQTLGNKPLLIGNTESEGSFALDLYDNLQQRRLSAPLAATSEELHHALEQFLIARYGLSQYQQEAQQLIEHYQRHMPDTSDDHPDGPSPYGALLLTLLSDAGYRQPTWQLARNTVAAGNANVYMYNFALPLQPPATGTPHNADLPFWFGSYDAPFYRAKFGDGHFQQQLSLAMRQALANFVHQGNPASPLLPAWPALHNVQTPKIMQLGCGETLGELVTATWPARLAPIETLNQPHEIEHS
ncbi:carboxylesterase/lipase family protein [Serratia liquefaciens]